jgi:hypothetical protein
MELKMCSQTLLNISAPFDDFIEERSFAIWSMERSLQRELTPDEKSSFTAELRLAFNMSY